MDDKDKLITLLKEENKRLKEHILKQEERIKELERRIGLNSNNSSKPPSSDGLEKVCRTSSLRENGKRKSGGQLGHKGTTLKQVANPYNVERVKLDSCPNCHSNLSETQVSSVYKSQVFDMPEITKPIVTEYQFESKVCSNCKKKVTSEKENFSKVPVQYGERIQSTALLLNACNSVPEKRTAAVMRKISKSTITSSTIGNISKNCAKKVAPVVSEVENKLKTVPVKNADESGIRVNGKTIWLHVLCNPEFAFYSVSEKRGDIPTNLIGSVVHDGFVSYYSKLKKVKHALCNAHHLRELKAVAEIDKERWAQHMSRILKLACYTVKHHPEEITVEWKAKFTKLYDSIVKKGLDYHENIPPLKQKNRGKTKRRPGHNLLLRLQKRREDTLRFLHDFEVPFTNNSAEQLVRPIKVKQKVSGCFRTFSGAQQFLAIKSYLATAQKQGHQIMDALTFAIKNQPLNF